MPWARRFDGAGASRGKVCRLQALLHTAANLFTQTKPDICNLPNALTGCELKMAGAPSQFGRRGVGSPLQPARSYGVQSASSALLAATQWNRAPKELSLKDLAPLDRDDDWALPDRAPAPPRPGLMTMLFSSRGRVCRRDYWTFNIAATMSAVLAILAAAVSLPAEQALMVAVPIALVSARIRSCLRIKRWHDRDKSAVWILVGLIPFVGWIWSFLECGLTRGTPGPNRYGASPI
jgi:uncharacterized membrane protein YhaH (DUF805 family)